MKLTVTTWMSAEVFSDMFGFDIPRNSSLISKIFHTLLWSRLLPLHSGLETVNQRGCRPSVGHCHRTASLVSNIYHSAITACSHSDHTSTESRCSGLKEKNTYTVNQSLTSEGVCRTHMDIIRWSPKQKTSEQPFDGGSTTAQGRFCSDTKRGFGVVTNSWIV